MRDDRECRNCGHAYAAHLHYRPGTDCAAPLVFPDHIETCGCRQFRPVRWWHSTAPRR